MNNYLYFSAMSEFSRNIRTKLIEEGNFRRYLLFGIGEIVLLVTGILIALSINSWDMKKSQRSDELNIYQNIQNRILEDREVIQGVIKYNTSYMKQFLFANGIIDENDRSRQDTLAKIALNLTKYSDFSKSSNIFQNLLNSGELKLLRNSTVITRLQELEETYIYLNRMENIHLQFVMEFVAHALFNKMHLSSGKAENENTLYAFQFQNLFLTSVSLMEEKDEIYQRALREIAAISDLLNKELSQ